MKDRWQSAGRKLLRAHPSGAAVRQDGSLGFRVFAARHCTVHLCSAPAGGDLGKHWHLAAVGGNLRKRVEDVQACLAELQRHLSAHSCRPAVVLHAASAGAIPACAVLNAQPEVGQS